MTALAIMVAMFVNRNISMFDLYGKNKHSFAANPIKDPSKHFASHIETWKVETWKAGLSIAGFMGASSKTALRRAPRIAQAHPVMP